MQHRAARTTALALLARVAARQGRFLHEIAETPLLKALLSSLLIDEAPVTFAVGIRTLLMLLPCLPTRLGPYLPSLWAVFVRGVRWQIIAEQAAGGTAEGATPDGASASLAVSPGAPAMSVGDVSEPASSPATTAPSGASVLATTDMPSSPMAPWTAPPPGERLEGWELLGTPDFR